MLGVCCSSWFDVCLVDVRVLVGCWCCSCAGVAVLCCFVLCLHAVVSVVALFWVVCCVLLFVRVFGLFVCVVVFVLPRCSVFFLCCVLCVSVFGLLCSLMLLYCV